jgi:hypothetical protein
VFTLLYAKRSDEAGDYHMAKMPSVNEGPVSASLLGASMMVATPTHQNMKHFILWADKFIARHTATPLRESILM